MGGISLLVASAWLASASAGAQDPTVTLPDAYKVQLENAHVRVVRVHYEAGARLAEHTHPAGTTAYIYLNDSDGVVFRHSGSSNRAVTRPAVKAGSIRVASGREEHHTVENPASTPSDFVRVWFKTADGGDRNPRRRLGPDEEFANAQMRITRVTLQDVPVTVAAQREPALVVLLPGGESRWIEAGGRVTIAPAAGAVEAVVRIDFLTAPR
jgi:hypothetical protein